MRFTIDFILGHNTSEQVTTERKTEEEDTLGSDVTTKLGFEEGQDSGRESICSESFDSLTDRDG